MVLIDMDRLRKELMAKGDIPIHEVFNTIWEQPIVNVSQQKVGKWIAHPIYAHLVCSKCLSSAPYDCKTNYCPNCGAKMEVKR